MATTTCIAVVALVPSLAGIVVFFLAAGCFQPVVLITRNLSLRQQLPEHAHTAGYSVMYTVQGVGYSISAIFAAVALDRSTPSTAILVGVAITLLLLGISVLAERRTLRVPEPGTDVRSDQSLSISR
jgi:predicted MFS family arabinose efflux permease